MLTEQYHNIFIVVNCGKHQNDFITYSRDSKLKLQSSVLSLCRTVNCILLLYFQIWKLLSNFRWVGYEKQLHDKVSILVQGAWVYSLAYCSKVNSGHLS